jgi:hypothetical protein
MDKGENIHLSRPFKPQQLRCWLKNQVGWCRQREKIDWQEPGNLIVGWCGQFLFFVVRQFSHQILIPDWTYFHCPCATQWRHPSQTQQETFLGQEF